MLADWLFVCFCRQEGICAASIKIQQKNSTKQHTHTTHSAWRESAAAALVAPLILLKKLNSKSHIWNYFGFKQGKDGKPIDDCRPLCRRCHQTRWAKGGNTSNLIKHLQCRHPDLYAEYQVSVPCLFSHWLILGDMLLVQAEEEWRVEGCQSITPKIHRARPRRVEWASRIWSVHPTASTPTGSVYKAARLASVTPHVRQCLLADLIEAFIHVAYNCTLSSNRSTLAIA